MGEREPGKETGSRDISILERDFVNPILSDAKEYLQTYGGLELALLFLDLESGERGVIQLSLPDMAEKRKVYFTELGLSIRATGREIREALFISEVWYVVPKDKVLSVAPSRHPNRKEAIAVMGRDAPGNRYTNLLQPFVRDAQNRITFEPTAMEEFNVSLEHGSHPVGLIDYLFKSIPLKRWKRYG